ncbi:SGNH hydrolase [Phlegmacium glaucopus]|nr:SGNH hydrolase [Phlegmacium glaucopus]
MAETVQDVFMLFGDSLTQGAWEPEINGFGQRLSYVYARKLDVLNRGLSGYNTEWSIPVFEQCIAKSIQANVPEVRVLTIWFGANDACIQPSPQHVPLLKFISNITYMVNMIKSLTSSYYSPTTRIILITPPPVNTFQRRADLESRQPPQALDRDFEVTRAYAEGVRQVAQSENVALVDVWSALWEAAGEDEKSLKFFLRDGLHLNAEGYRIMYEELITTIREVYPEVHYDNLEYVFPVRALSWRDIINNPAYKSTS